MSFAEDLGHGTKKASYAGRRLYFGQSLRDLAVKRKLLGLEKAKWPRQ